MINSENNNLIGIQIFTQNERKSNYSFSNALNSAIEKITEEINKFINNENLSKENILYLDIKHKMEKDDDYNYCEIIGILTYWKGKV